MILSVLLIVLISLIGSVASQAAGFQSAFAAKRGMLVLLRSFVNPPIYCKLTEANAVKDDVTVGLNRK